MQENRSRGGIFALSAFLCWGLFPLYFKAVGSVPALEMLSHRALWVALSIGPVIVVLGWSKRVRAVFMDRRAIRYVFWSGLLLTINWLIFIWAIANDYVLQSSLGYYINPLFNVLLGVVVLGERLNRVQWGSVAIACCGVGVMVFVLGEMPWIALSLALTFALYGLLRKQAPVDAMSGLFVETLLVSPLAIAYLTWIWLQGSAVVTPDSGNLLYLVLLSGIVTATPLILFTAGARRLPLSVLGLFQYIVPSGHFVLAVFIFGEPFTQWHLISFALIWAALALYTADVIRNRNIKTRDHSA
ncbi:MAG: EamA family transporter RarD [Rhodospirillales bacterium]|nr:EamA family transporter RarD [Rhodospirillales bacterium]